MSTSTTGSREELTFGIDMGAPNGDKTALSIKKDDKLFTFVGDEAEAILAYAHQREIEARIDELQNRLRVQFIPSHWERLRNETNSWAAYVDRRIAALTTQHNKGEGNAKED